MGMDIYDYIEEKKVSYRRVLDLTLLTNPLGPSNKAKIAMRTALKTVSRFPDPEARRLRRSIARIERIGTENILFGPGSTRLLDLIIAALQPRRVLIPAPVPGHHASALQRAGIDVVPLPFHKGPDFSLDVDRLMMSLEGVDMLLFPNPHPMTGTLIPPPVLHGVIDRIEGSAAFLILDEGLIEFTEAPSLLERAVQSRNLLVLRSFSLYHGLAGLGLGYVVGHESLLRLLSGGAPPFPVNAVVGAAAISSLRDKGFRERTGEFIKIEKAYLTGKLGRIAGVEVIDTSCPFVLVRLQMSARDLKKRLEERDILAEAFEDEKGMALLRASVRRHRENARFAKTLLRIVRL
ncbi:MAG TPA: histidinol-phosphate transaminase [Syntrophorhabdales bacterium]|nr:histidinol-phosphate transaminase [Syntrophorhabdales bacterium]